MIRSQRWLTWTQERVGRCRRQSRERDTYCPAKAEHPGSDESLSFLLLSVKETPQADHLS